MCAASSRIVPLPHMGSRRGIPGCPSSKAQNSRGEIFPERRFTRRDTLAAFEERLPCGIEIKRKLAITQMTLDRNIGFSRIDVRAPARDPANLIAHRVFDF
jgi:hypothetical protein